MWHAVFDICCERDDLLTRSHQHRRRSEHVQPFALAVLVAPLIMRSGRQGGMLILPWIIAWSIA